jgi:hypothetical protein
MSEGVELESNARRCWGGYFGARDAAVPSRDIGDIAEIRPDIFGRPTDEDGGFEVHGMIDVCVRTKL